MRQPGADRVAPLDKKLGETSDKVSQATVELVTLQERLMLARIRFQDGVAEPSLEKAAALARSGG